MHAVSSTCIPSTVVSAPVLSTVNVTEHITATVVTSNATAIVNTTSVQATVVTTSTEAVVVNTTEPVHKVIVSDLGVKGDAGIQGIQGPGTTDTTVSAGESINGHRVVTRVLGNIYHADKDTLSHQSQVLGLSTHSGVASTDVNVLTMGYIVEPSWNWTPDKPLFLGSGGLLTEVPPTTGFLLQVAQSISQTEVWVNIKVGIALS
jgi:hypothetical protein